MNRQFRALILGIIVVFPSAFAHGYDGLLYMDPLYGVSLTSDVVYGVGNTNLGPMNLLADVYAPSDIGLGAVPDDRPVVILQDGGAWTSGDKTNGRVVTAARYLAERGYSVFITDYRQVGDSPISGPGPWRNLNFSSNGSLAGTLVTIYPSPNVIRAGIEDFATAINYVRTHAAQYDVDPNRLGAAGGSAGGVNVMDLQYNGVVPAAYKAQAVVSIVGTMYGDWDKVVAGGPPLFMLNNALDPLIWYNSDVEPNLHHQLQAKGIYYEQWMQDPNLTDHNIHYDQHPLADPNDPYLADKQGDASELVLERMRDFLADHLAGGAVPISSQSLTAASTDNGSFVQFDYNGNATTVAHNPSLVTPLDVAHDAANNRYVVDAALSRILKYDGAGAGTVFADQSKGLLLPTSIAITGNGDVYAANYLSHQILKFDSSGNGSVFANAASGLQSPFGLALDGSGKLFVAEADSHRVLMLDAQGNATVFASASNGLVTPIALAFDAAGNLYVVDAALSKIFKFDSNGIGSVFADSSDGLLLPTGIAIDSVGNLYVSNYLSDVIIKINSAGVGSAFATAGDGINGPFGLDLLNSNTAFASLADRVDIAAVPEASSLILLVGAAGLATIVPALRRRAKFVR